MIQCKRAVVSLATYSLILVLLVSLLVFSFYFKGVYENNSKEKTYEIDALNSASSLRNSLINLMQNENTNVTYSNPTDDTNIYLVLNDSNIIAFKETEDILVEVSVTNFGVDFCDYYEVSPLLRTTFNYNGSCIAKVYEE
jgi:hypothetical protein